MIIWGNTGQFAPAWARLWLYGPAGSGKTMGAAYFPRAFFVLVYNENSQTTLQGLTRLMGQQFNYAILGTPEAPRADAAPRVRQDFEQLCNALLESAAQGEHVLHERFGQTLVADSMTHYNDLAIAEIIADSKRKKMEQQEWGLLRNHYLHIRDVLWRLPMHVVFTSLPFAKTDAAQNVIDAGPAIQGTGGDLLPSSCDALGYCETELTGERVTYFKQRGAFPARHRFPGVSEGPIPNHHLWAHLAPALGR